MIDLPKLSKLFVTAIAFAMMVTLVITLWRYLQLPIYLDHAEPGVASKSWLLLQGKDLYQSLTSDQFVLTAYGPITYVVNALTMALVGSSIMTSKLAGVIACFASVGLFLYGAKQHGFSVSSQVGLIVLIALILVASPASFWTRPDAYLMVLVAFALCVAVACERRAIKINDLLAQWGGPLAIALAGGLAFNLKIHALLYFVPLVFRFCMNRWLLTWALCLVVFLITVALPFLSPSISLANYLEGLSGIIASRSLDVGLLKSNLRWAAAFLSPLLLLGLLVLTGRLKGEGKDVVFVVMTLLAIIVTLYPASVPGAGWYHILPFASLVAHAVVVLLNKLKPSSPAQIGAMAVFTLAFAILSITPTKRYHRNINNLMWYQAVEGELQQILADYGSWKIEMGYGHDVAESYKLSYLRPLVVMAGNEMTMSATMAMEMTFAGKPVPEQKLALVHRCEPQIWLIPKGEEPFSMTNYFGGRFAFWPQYSKAVQAQYQKTKSYQYFDIWTCKTAL